MAWRWIVRLGLVVLAWDLTLIGFGMFAEVVLPAWLTTATVFTGLAYVGLWRPIVFGPHRARGLWQERPRWWPLSLAFGMSTVVVAIVASTLTHLPAAEDQRGVAAVSAFFVSASLPVFEARYRAGASTPAVSPAVIPRHVRRARKRAAQRRRGRDGSPPLEVPSTHYDDLPDYSGTSTERTISGHLPEPR